MHYRNDRRPDDRSGLRAARTSRPDAPPGSVVRMPRCPGRSPDVRANTLQTPRFACVQPCVNSQSPTKTN